MDPWRVTAEVVVIEKGRIAAVGERALLAAYPGARREDLIGRALLPGFIDAHNHLSIAALHPLWADLSRTCTREELARALAAQAAREPEARWVRGAGWDEAAGGLVPDRHALDALGLDRPVIVVHYSLHQCVVSSQALDELGIGRTTPDPPGGTIERGPDGEPTGLPRRARLERGARALAGRVPRPRALGWADRRARPRAGRRRHHLRARRRLPALGGERLCPAAPNRSGDGAPAPVHGRLGSRS